MQKYSKPQFRNNDTHPTGSTNYWRIDQCAVKLIRIELHLKCCTRRTPQISSPYPTHSSRSMLKPLGENTSWKIQGDEYVPINNKDHLRDAQNLKIEISCWGDQDHRWNIYPSSSSELLVEYATHETKVM